MTPISLGIKLNTGTFRKIIPRNTAIPVTKEKEFNTVRDYQTKVGVKIFEGERAMAIDNHLLGEVKLEGLPSMRAYLAKVMVQFEVDVDGILHVRVKDEKNQANNAKVTIKAETGRLNEADIERMMRDAEKYAADDEANLRRGAARQYFEVFMNELYNNCTVTDHWKGILGQDAADLIAIKAEEDRQWLDANQFASEEAIDERLKAWNLFMGKWSYRFEGIEGKFPWRKDIIEDQKKQDEDWTRKRSRGEL